MPIHQSDQNRMHGRYVVVKKANNARIIDAIVYGEGLSGSGGLRSKKNTFMGA